jgi:hypothetical protein
LLDKGLPQSQTRFSEKLTQNLDFSGSLKLSELHGQLRLLEKKMHIKSGSKPADEQKKALNLAFERVRRSIYQNIEHSFNVSIIQPRFPLPQINLENEVLDLSVYQKFYQAQQSEMSAKIQGLRTYVRETLSASSVNMAKLALIDTTLEETIGFPLRSGFAAISKVILKYSQKIEAQWSKSDKSALIAHFHDELQQLLLAELELRLQPIQGLIDAFNQEV